MQFGRFVLARVLGQPERGDWKACVHEGAQSQLRIES